MEKISVSVVVPAIGSTCDFMVPDDMAVRDAAELIMRILRSEYGISGGDSEIMLFDTADGLMLNPECSFHQQEIADGAKLVLM